MHCAASLRAVQQMSLTWPVRMLRCTHRGRERVIAWKPADHAAASWGFLPGMEPVTASGQPVGKSGSAGRRQRCVAGARSCGAPWVAGEVTSGLTGGSGGGG